MKRTIGKDTKKVEEFKKYVAPACFDLSRLTTRWCFIEKSKITIVIRL